MERKMSNFFESFNIVDYTEDKDGYFVIHFKNGYLRNGIKIPQQYVESFENSEEFRRIVEEFELNDRIVNIPHIHWMNWNDSVKVQRFLMYKSPIDETIQFGIFLLFQFKDDTFRVKHFGWTTKDRILKEYSTWQEMQVDKLRDKW